MNQPSSALARKTHPRCRPSMYRGAISILTTLLAKQGGIVTRKKITVQNATDLQQAIVCVEVSKNHLTPPS